MLPRGIRVRQKGSGRKSAATADPKIVHLLQRMLEETTVGDPMSLLKWTTELLAQIKLTDQLNVGIRSHEKLLKAIGQRDLNLRSKLIGGSWTGSTRREAPCRF